MKTQNPIKVFRGYRTGLWSWFCRLSCPVVPGGPHATPSKAADAGRAHLAAWHNPHHREAVQP